MNCNSSVAPLSIVSESECNNICMNSPINIVCKQMIISNEQRNLAIQGENNVIKKTFLIPKITENGDSLEGKSFSIVIKKSNGNIMSENINNPVILENFIQLDWTVDNEITNIEGKLFIQILASGDNFEWKTIPEYFNIIESIN